MPEGELFLIFVSRLNQAGVRYVNGRSSSKAKLSSLRHRNMLSFVSWNIFAREVRKSICGIFVRC
jgi:hypothetical protein